MQQFHQSLNYLFHPLTLGKGIVENTCFGTSMDRYGKSFTLKDHDI